MLLRDLVYYALLIGVLSGVVVTVVQFWQVIPIIQSAESFEDQAVVSVSVADGATTQGHSHSHQSWAPSEGVERTFWTFLSNSFTAAGFAMLLLSIMLFVYRNKQIAAFNLKRALYWGGAGYLVFFLAPSVGMPPEIPLANVAPVEVRQLWWLLAVVCTAAGLASLVFIKMPWRLIAPPLLIALPHLIGAPDIEGEMFINQTPDAVIRLEELAKQFISATAIVNAVLWFLLGIFATLAMQKILIMSNK